MIGKLASRARCSQACIGDTASMAVSPPAARVSVPITTSLLCLASPTRKVKSSAVEGSAHCRSSMISTSGVPPESLPAERKPYMSCIDCTIRL